MLQTLPSTEALLGASEGNAMHLALSSDKENALAWSKDALDHAHTQEQAKLVGYLETVLEDVLWEMRLDASF
jgi:hypothetical protein